MLLLEHCEDAQVRGTAIEERGCSQLGGRGTRAVLGRVGVLRGRPGRSQQSEEEDRTGALVLAPGEEGVGWWRA